MEKIKIKKTDNVGEDSFSVNLTRTFIYFLSLFNIFFHFRILWLSHITFFSSAFAFAAALPHSPHFFWLYVDLPRNCFFSQSNRIWWQHFEIEKDKARWKIEKKTNCVAEFVTNMSYNRCKVQKREKTG